MKPDELYSRKPEKEINDLRILQGFYYNHIPELDGMAFSSFDSTRDNKRVSIRIYKEFDFDGCRFWRLASVWLDGKPVMIIQNAGRDGDDHAKRFITDNKLYFELVQYLHTLIPFRFGEMTDRVSTDEDVPGLTDFYGNKLDGSFGRY